MSDNDTAAFDTAMCTSSNSNKLKVIKNTKAFGVFIRFLSEKTRFLSEKTGKKLKKKHAAEQSDRVRHYYISCVSSHSTKYTVS